MAQLLPGGHRQPGPLLTEPPCTRCPPQRSRSSARQDTGPAERRPSRRAMAPGVVLSAAQGVCAALPSCSTLSRSGPAQGGRERKGGRAGQGRGGDRTGGEVPGGELPWVCSGLVSLSENAGLSVLPATALGRRSCVAGAALIGQAGTWQETGLCPGHTARAEPSTRAFLRPRLPPGGEEETPCPGVARGILPWPEGQTEPLSLSPWGLSTVLRFCPWGSPGLAGPTELQGQSDAGVPGASGAQGRFGHLRS